MACDNNGCTKKATVGVHLRRPSDPAELCEVMSFCVECAKTTLVGYDPSVKKLPADEVPVYGTSAQISEWVEEHGHKHGILWY